MNIRHSVLDETVLVFEVEDGDTGEMVELLKKTGYGCALWGEGVDEPIIVIDTRIAKEDWCTKNHLLAIEAHELGHIKKESKVESVAELAGIELLNEKEYYSAAKILINRGVISDEDRTRYLLDTGPRLIDVGSLVIVDSDGLDFEYFRKNFGLVVKIDTQQMGDVCHVLIDDEVIVVPESDCVIMLEAT